MQDVKASEPARERHRPGCPLWFAVPAAVAPCCGGSAMSTKFRLAGLLLGLALALLVGLPPLGRGADEGAAKNDDHKNQRNVSNGQDRNHAKTNNAGQAVEDINLA